MKRILLLIKGCHQYRKQVGYKKFLQELIELIIENFKDYWLGYVSVQVKTIYIASTEEDRPHTVSIYLSRRKIGQTYSSIPIESIPSLVKNLENGNERFELSQSVNGGLVLYTVNKYQRLKLIELLKGIL